ncbi:unnamed protein product, partial [Brassica oleracea]
SGRKRENLGDRVGRRIQSQKVLNYISDLSLLTLHRSPPGACGFRRWCAPRHCQNNILWCLFCLLYILILRRLIFLSGIGGLLASMVGIRLWRILFSFRGVSRFSWVFLLVLRDTSVSL